MKESYRIRGAEIAHLKETVDEAYSAKAELEKLQKKLVEFKIGK